jgi:hypothetical protein
MRTFFSSGVMILLSALFANIAAGAPSACVATCAEAATKVQGPVNLEYETLIGKKTYRTLCIANPSGKNLFPDDKNPISVRKRLDTYCDYNPAFRLCFVCERLKDKNEEAKAG